MSKSIKTSDLFPSSARRRRRETQRTLRAELLESRTLMASDANPWHNMAFPADVDGDRALTPRDALLIINGLNEGGARPLGSGTVAAAAVSTATTGGESEANTYSYDVDNDGWIAPMDALKLVNLLNGEGEPALMRIGITATKLDGTSLPIDAGTGFPAVNVGESFLVQMVTQDLRTVPSGVAAAYSDVTFNNKVRFDNRETQLITFTSAPSTGTFTLTVAVPGQAAKTTGPIAYSKANDATTRDNIVAALLAPGIGFFQPGEVIAEKPRPATQGPSLGTNYAIKFGGRYANINMPEMTATWTSGGATTIAVTQYNAWYTNPPSTPDFRMSFTFDAFRDAMQGSLGEGANANVLNEAGATTFSTSDGAEYVVFESEFTALAGGTVTFGTNPGEDSASAPLLHGTGGTNITTADVMFNSLNVVVLQKVTAVDDTAIVDEGSLASAVSNRINVMANDMLNAGGSKRIVSFTQGTAGTVARFDNGTPSNLADDQLTYQPATNFAGSDTFTYVFGDGNGNTALATVSVTVNPINDPPVNVFPLGAQSTAEDTAKTFSTANGNAFSVSDLDANGGNLQVVFTATNGTLTLVNGAGVTVTGGGASLTLTGSQANLTTALGAGLTFTPTSNFSGNATLVMASNDQGNTGAPPAGQTNPLTDTDTITIAVNSVNDVPVNSVPAGPLSTQEATPLTLSGATAISTSDVDAGTNNVVMTLGLGPTNAGVLNVLSTANITAGGNGTATLTLTGSIANINTALASGLRFTPRTDAQNPANNFIGTATLTVTTNDQGNSGGSPPTILSDTDVISIEVQPTTRPFAANDSAATSEDSTTGVTVNVLQNDIPNPGATLILKSFTQPANGAGTVTQVGSDLKYVPAADVNGTVTFTYTINDTSASKPDSTGTVTVNVTEMNDAPSVTDDPKSTNEDVALVFPASDLTANDSKGPANESGQTLTVTLPSGTTTKGGTVTISNGQITYTPPANYNNVIGGADTFAYTITDNGTTEGVANPKTASGSVTITISEVNDAPVPVTDTAMTTEDPTVPLTMLGSTLTGNDGKGGGTDESGQTLTIQSVAAVTTSAGTVAVSGADVVYTPAADFNGQFVFTYVVQDNGTTSGVLAAKTATGTVTVTVTEVNDSPTAGPDSVTGVKNTLTEYTSAQLLANDTKGPANESGQTLRITSVSPTSTLGGTVSLNTTTGVVTYMPPTGVDGQNDTFTYVVSDNGTTAGVLNEKTATGTVTVGIVNFIPMTVSGYVYMDLDNDGVKDGPEAALAGVDITISGTDFNGVAIANRSVMTDRNGFYSFSNIAPGSYWFTEGQAANMVDGLETAGSSRLTTSGNDRFQFVMSLSDNVGLSTHTFANNNFAERSLSSSFLAIHALIVPNITGTNPGQTPKGLLFSFSDSAASTLDWYSIQDGWTGNNLSSFTLSGDRMSATLRMTNSLNQVLQTTVTVESGRLRVQQDSAGRPVAYVTGSFSDFNWTQVAVNGEGEGEDASSTEQLLAAVLGGGSSGDYAASVDAAMAEAIG